MIEIDISKLERGKREGMVTVRRGGKVFQRKQKLGRKEPESESEYERNKREYDRLRAIPMPKDQTIDQMIASGDALNAARNKMNKSNPAWVAEQERYKEEYERLARQPKPKPEYITPKNIKKGMIIRREDEKKLFEVVKVARVNAYVLPYPSLPEIDQPEKVRITSLDSYVKER